MHPEDADQEKHVGNDVRDQHGLPSQAVEVTRGLPPSHNHQVSELDHMMTRSSPVSRTGKRSATRATARATIPASRYNVV